MDTWGVSETLVPETMVISGGIVSVGKGFTVIGKALEVAGIEQALLLSKRQLIKSLLFTVESIKVALFDPAIVLSTLH